MAKRKPKRHTGYYGNKMAKCEGCGGHRPFGQECPVCDMADDNERPGVSGSLPHTEHYGTSRLISESDVVEDQ